MQLIKYMQVLLIHNFWTIQKKTTNVYQVNGQNFVCSIVKAVGYVLHFGEIFSILFSICKKVGILVPLFAVTVFARFIFCFKNGRCH